MSTVAASSSASGSAPGPASFWIAREHAPTEVDAVVVGGGIVGLSTAFWWQRALGPERRVLLLEAGALAQRASGRNAGYLITGSPEYFADLVAQHGETVARRFWELCRENRELLRGELIDSGRVECDFRPGGSWIAVVDDPVGQARLAESGEQLRALGFDIQWREGAEVSRAAGSSRVTAALHQPRDGGIDPLRLCRGIAHEGGFQVRTGSPVHGLEPHPDGRVRVRAAGGDVIAERAVVALNAYAPTLLPHLAGVVRPVRAQMLALEPGPQLITGVWYLNEGYEYIRQLGDGTVLLGGCRRTALDEEVGFLEAPTATVQSALERFLAATYPDLAGRRVIRRWAGTMAFTPDGMPSIGEVPGVSGALYAAGFNGHGMSLGFVTGRYLAGRAMGEFTTPLL